MKAKIQSLTLALNLLMRTSTSIAKLHCFVWETLLARVAIQPFVTNIQTLPGWQVEICEGMWGSALLLCIYFLGLAITALFLDYLLGSPGHLSWVWVCKIGPLIGISVILIVLDTILSVIAIGFISWVSQGHLVGMVCSILGVLSLADAVTSNFLRQALKATLQKLE